ncbi:MAG: hypothetical protein JWO03_1563 [Bacteroidetes bacterium]|nr:hypothetical protein [Bacteroidota bacterium]
MVEFDKQYQGLNIPGVEFDYRENLKHIAAGDSLNKQAAFFADIKKQLSAINRTKLNAPNKVNYDQIAYECSINAERTGLEKSFVSDPLHAIPANGLSSLDKGWYLHYIRYFTSTEITPDELYAFGEKEVAHIHSEIHAIQKQLGYEHDSAGFYKKLQSDDFVLTDKPEIIKRYEAIKATVYKNVGHLFIDTNVADVAFMEWPNANKFTPPGYYSPKKDNAVGTAVFYFNFSEGRHNTRSMDWLFMHECVPGHHYQWCMRDKVTSHPAFKEQFFYPGNVEGWAAYIEYYGKEMGLYQDAWSYLGKWEWDLVRSTRILIDVGIHHKGWTKEKAIACWKQNIPGQDAIAEREVTRCTNWPAQALSYKVGAQKIIEMRDALKQKQGKDFDIRKFHTQYLSYGNIPMELIEKDMVGNEYR